MTKTADFYKYFIKGETRLIREGYDTLTEARTRARAIKAMGHSIKVYRLNEYTGDEIREIKF